jgi:predicted RNA binding protein YcfA (HicA-like mRNA interferase family)
MNNRKLLEKILASPKNVQFKDMVLLVQSFGFRLSRIRGGYHIFVHPDVHELVNLQEVNRKAKPYQDRQFLELIEKYDSELGD